MIRKPAVALIAGVLVILALAVLGTYLNAPRLVADLEEQSQAAIAEVGGQPVRAVFPGGIWTTRHPVLHGAEGLSDSTRARIANAVAQVPGIGGIRWADSTARIAQETQAQRPVRCQDDVDALLRSRTIRFEESSSRIERSSRDLIDEVARALRPCLGAIIAITGHTDSSGPEPGNLELSRERADAVRQALVRRGIPADGLRVRGLGSSEPVEGLDPSDPANRRIEFSVVAKVPIRPTVVDTPGPH